MSFCTTSQAQSGYTDTVREQRGFQVQILDWIQVLAQTWSFLVSAFWLKLFLCSFMFGLILLTFYQTSLWKCSIPTAGFLTVCLHSSVVFINSHSCLWSIILYKTFCHCVSVSYRPSGRHKLRFFFSFLSVSLQLWWWRTCDSYCIQNFSCVWVSSLINVLHRQFLSLATLSTVFFCCCLFCCHTLIPHRPSWINRLLE